MGANGERQPEREELSDSEQSFMSHLIELRSRLLKSVVAVLAVTLVLMPVANRLYEWLSRPLMEQMERLGAQMIATEVASPFLAPFKLTCFVALAICVPYIFYQLWAFVAPGLYRHEKRLALPLMASSTLLFYCGIAFAYFAVFPLVFGFLTHAAPEGVTVMTDISKYLDFVLLMFFAFGVAFEVPVATYLVVRTGISTREALAAKRPYVIVGAFVVSAVLTPPDVISQTMMAVPVCLLYELGLLFCRVMIRPEAAADPEQAVTPKGS